MGGGLSDLQRDILRRAYHNRSATPERLRLKYAKDLREWEAVKRDWERNAAWCLEHGIREPGLSRPEPGDRPYRPEYQWDVCPREIVNAICPPSKHGPISTPHRRGVQAAVSRAITRLIQRELLHSCHGIGLRLTDEGLALTKNLLVNIDDPVRCVSR